MVRVRVGGISTRKRANDQASRMAGSWLHAKTDAWSRNGVRGNSSSVVGKRLGIALVREAPTTYALTGYSPNLSYGCAEMIPFSRNRSIRLDSHRNPCLLAVFQKHSTGISKHDFER